jgi:hypothetical protein
MLRYILFVSLGFLLGLGIVFWNRNTKDKTSLEMASARVRAEVESEHPRGVCKDFLLALATMNFIQERESPAIYNDLEMQGLIRENLSPETCLALGAGRCGNHAESFYQIVRKAGFTGPVRSVAFLLHDEEHDNNRTHVAIEVFYKGAWRYFDVTWGLIVRRRHAGSQDDLLSLEETRGLIQQGEPWRDLMVWNSAKTWTQHEIGAGWDIFDHLIWPRTDVLMGHTGTLNLRPTSARDRYCMAGVVPFIGHVEDHCGNTGKIDYQLDPKDLAGQEKHTLAVSTGKVGRSPDAMFVAKDQEQVLEEIPIADLHDNETILIDVSRARGSIILQVISEDRKGFVQVKDITIQ